MAEPPVGGELATAAFTWMVKGEREAVLLPSLAVMVILPVAPTSLAVGVPVNAPVVELKLAQAGWPVIE